MDVLGIQLECVCMRPQSTSSLSKFARELWYFDILLDKKSPGSV